MSENENLPKTRAPGEVEAYRGDEERFETPDDPVAVPYHAVHPPDVPYDEFNYAQRRAVILDRLERVGHPQALNQTYRELGDEFGVSTSTIHRDMKTLAAYMSENLDRDHAHIADTVFRGAVLELVEAGDHLEAAEVTREWFEWLADMGVLDRAADRLELDATHRMGAPEDAAYRVIQDDEAEAVEFVEATGEPQDGEASQNE